MKRFLIIGSINAVTYKEVFPYIKSREVHYRPECYGIKCYYNTNKKMTTTWYTTLIPPYIPLLELTKSYTPDAYPKYDNYDAINVDKTINIPYDYQGVMGVPITFLDKYCPDQFEIVKFRKGDDDKDLSVNGVCPYFRILIRHRK